MWFEFLSRGDLLCQAENKSHTLPSKSLKNGFLCEYLLSIYDSPESCWVLEAGRLQQKLWVSLQYCYFQCVALKLLCLNRTGKECHSREALPVPVTAFCLVWCLLYCLLCSPSSRKAQLPTVLQSSMFLSCVSFLPPPPRSFLLNLFLPSTLRYISQSTSSLGQRLVLMDAEEFRGEGAKWNVFSRKDLGRMLERGYIWPRI